MKKIIALFGLICISISILQAQTAAEIEQIRSQANMGNAEAQFELGFCYSNGLGLPVDHVEAEKWVRRSANKGFAAAECTMGIFYEMGIDGVITPNEHEAAKWYKKSAEQGYAEAQLYLGNCYMFGFGLAQSNEEALKWYRKSAEQGVFQAEITLGMYYKNIGDNTNALYWLEKAYASAKANKQEVDQEMWDEYDENFITPLEAEINEIKTGSAEKKTTYLIPSTTSLYFNGTGSTSTITVSTDGKSYEVTLLPSWCRVINQTADSFQIVCQSNDGEAREDWFKIKSGDKEVRINVEQAAGKTGPSAKFENIWVEHNVLEIPYNIYSRRGMRIHVKFSVEGMLNKRGDCVVWFYFSNGEVLKDYNRLYRTSDGQVAASGKFKPTYESCIFNDFTIFMPYDELHLSRGYHHLKFKIGLFDHNDKQMATSEETHFSVN